MNWFTDSTATIAVLFQHYNAIWERFVWQMNLFKSHFSTAFILSIFDECFCWWYLEIFWLHCGSYNFYLQMFEFTNHGIELSEFHRFSYSNQALGFYIMISGFFQKRIYLPVDEDLLRSVLVVTQDIAFTQLQK